MPGSGEGAGGVLVQADGLPESAVPVLPDQPGGDGQPFQVQVAMDDRACPFGFGQIDREVDLLAGEIDWGVKA